MLQGRGGRVLRRANSKRLADLLPQLFVHRGNTRLAVQLDEVVALGHHLEFALNHGLIADERPVEIVRKRHVAPGLPVADGLRLLELARKRGLRPHVQPEREVRAQRHGIQAAQIVAVDPAHHAAGDERENVAIRKHHGSRAQRGENAVLHLVEEIRRVHQPERQPRHRVFRQQLIDIFSDEIGPAQPAGLYRETFGLQPLLEQSNLRGPAGAAHPFKYRERAGDFARIEADERLSKKGLRDAIIARRRLVRGRGWGRCSGGHRRRLGRDWLLLAFRGAHSATSRRGANRFKSIFSATIARICFCNLFTGNVPSSTTKLSLSTILSYSSRIRAWNSLKLSARSKESPRSIPAS